MAKQKRTRASLVRRALKQKQAWAQMAETLTSAENLAQSPSTHAAADIAADPAGSCRYADGLGQMQCESPVGKSYCDEKSGFFTPDGRC